MLLATSLALVQEDAPQVAASLSLAGARTGFKAGQPVELVLSFSGVAGRYNMNASVYRGTPEPDKIVFTPPDGVAKIYSGSYDAIQLTPIGDQPVNLRLTLNDWYRFDKPGHSSVR